MARDRIPPRYKPRPGVCSLCHGELPPRCRTWCHDCPTLWHVATSSDSARRHLTALHGDQCWGCGTEWEPGVTREWERSGYVSGGHLIRGGPEGWRTGASCEWPGPVLGPPAPRRVLLEVEHVRPLWSLTDEERTQLRWWLPFNLQLLCRTCHKVKTRREAGERARARRGLPPEHSYANILPSLDLL